MVSNESGLVRPTIVEIARRAAGLTQGQLASFAGTTQSAVSEYETRRKSPRLSVVERLVWAAEADLAIRPRVEFEYAQIAGTSFPVPNRLWRVEPPRCFGTVHIPDLINMTDQDSWDMRDRAQRLRAYELLIGHGSASDIRSSIDGPLLAEAWDELLLEKRLRAAWQPAVDLVRPRSWNVFYGINP